MTNWAMTNEEFEYELFLEQLMEARELEEEEQNIRVLPSTSNRL